MADFYDVNRAIDKPNLLGALQQGIGFGNQQRALREERADEATLRGLAPAIMGGDAAALEQAAAINAPRAAALKAAGDVKWQTLKGGVQYVKQALASGKPEAAQSAWATVRPYFAKASGVDIANIPESFAEAQPHFANLEAKLAMIEGGQAGGQPTGYRELEMKLRAAGYQPGTPEWQNAVRVALGTEGRASSAAMQTVEVENSDGTTTTYTFDPRKGRYTPFSAALGGAAPAPPAAPMPASGQADPSQVFASLKTSVPGLRVTDEGIRTPEQNAALPNSVPNSYHLTGQAIDIGRPSPEQQAGITQWAQANGYEVVNNYADGHWHLEPAGGGGSGGGAIPAPAGPVPGTSMAPGARKFAEESGTQQARIAAMPQVNALEAQGAGMTTAAQEAAKTAALPQQLTAQAVGEGQKVTAKADAERVQALRSSLPELRNTQAALLDAYNGFKDGTYKSGPIVGNVPVAFQSPSNQYLLTTINDQILATAERMKGTLSDKDVAFLKSATFNLTNDEQANMNIIGRKLRIINEAIQRAQGAAGGASSPAVAAPAGGGQRRATNPQTGEVLVLVNGQWVPE